MGKRRHDPVSDEEQEAMETGDESEMEKPLKAKKQKVHPPTEQTLITILTDSSRLSGPRRNLCSATRTLAMTKRKRKSHQ